MIKRHLGTAIPATGLGKFFQSDDLTFRFLTQNIEINPMDFVTPFSNANIRAKRYFRAAIICSVYTLPDKLSDLPCRRACKPCA